MPLQDAWSNVAKDPWTVRPKPDVVHQNIRDSFARHVTVVVGNTTQLGNDSTLSYKKSMVKGTQHRPVLPPATTSSRWRTHYQVHGDVIVPLLLALITLALSVWQIPLHSAIHGSRGQLACLIPIFMVLGGSIVHTALAVTIASPREDSLHFGCGWLSYSLSTLPPALAGTRDLFPRPEMNCKVLNFNSCHSYNSNSWLLDRFLRDMELQHVPLVSPNGLTIQIFDAVAPTDSICWLATIHENAASMKIMFSQLAISIFAIYIHRDISIFLLFALCVFLMQTIVSLPVWREQKFPARKDDGKGAVYALMRGHGGRFMSIIRNADPESWNLEDLAGSGETQYNYIHTLQGPILVFVFLSFLIFTVLSTYLSDTNAMYMLAILALGTVGNVLAASLPRESWAHGFNIEPVDVISDDQDALKALQKLEETYEGLGEPLVKEFFPGGLRLSEETWWAEIKERRAGRKVQN